MNYHPVTKQLNANITCSSTNVYYIVHSFHCKRKPPHIIADVVWYAI